MNRFYTLRMPAKARAVLAAQTDETMRRPRLARAVATPLVVLWIVGMALAWLGCRTLRPEGDGAARAAGQETLILVSLDGFRWDYLDRAPAANLARLAAQGVRAERLVPSFPSKTFPNHYTIATGLRPGHHGIVANTMYDPEFDAEFSLGDRDAVVDGRWWGGEPIWVTAERQGQTTAAFFWPGTEAEIRGVRPTFWKLYEHETPHDERVGQVLRWLALPPDERPTFVTLYFSDVDSAGHDHGPEAGPELDAAIARVDASIGRLLEGLDEIAMSAPDPPSVNLVIVSDHGMTATASDRVILLDDYLDLDSVKVIDWNPVVAIRPPQSEVETVYERLVDAHPHLAVYRRSELPEGWAYRDHRRIAPIIGIADDGWSVAERAEYERDPDSYDGGNHGYAPEVETMGGLFVGWGPAFESGLRLPAIDNIHVYELLCRVLGLEPAPNDGSPEILAGALRHDP